MDQLIAVYVEDINTGGQGGFEWFEVDKEEEADLHLQRVVGDIKEYGRESDLKAVKRFVDYDRENNRVTFN